MNTLGIGGIGPPEIIIIAGIVFLLFGARKLPELARSMGSSVTQFKKGLKDGGDAKPSEQLASGSGTDDSQASEASEATKEKAGEPS